LNPIRVVFLKELTDGVRDRRSLMSLLVFPVVGPLIIALMLAMTPELLADDNEISLPVIGRENAPALITFLEDRGVVIVDAPADPMGAIRSRKLDVVLVIPDDYSTRFRAGRPATVELFGDAFNDRGGAARRTRRLLQGYATKVGTLRLLARGVSPDLATPVAVQDVDLSTPRSRAAIFLNFIPMFVLLAAFIGGMYSATDSTAGERERGSLEPLLLNPITRRALVLGKWLAAVAFSAFTLTFTFFCTLVALGRVPIDELGISLTLEPFDIAIVLATTLPLAFFASAAQLLAASFARSFREAQTYLSLMVFIPTLPAALLTVSPLDSELWMMAIPVLGQQVIMMDVIQGDAVQPVAIVLAGVAALAGALICVRFTAVLFQREQIIEGR
jgi:sodium transport system permease protein